MNYRHVHVHQRRHGTQKHSLYGHAFTIQNDTKYLKVQYTIYMYATEYRVSIQVARVWLTVQGAT